MLAWPVAAVGIALVIAYHLLDRLNGHRLVPPIADSFALLAFLAVGALIAWRRPDNPIGWICLVAMCFIAIGGTYNLADQYAYYAVVTRPGSLPGPDWVSWAGKLLLNIGFFGGMLSILLLFPDGRLPSPRWRPLVAAAVVGVVALLADSALAPGVPQPSGRLAFQNPAGIEAAGDLFRAAEVPTAIVLIGVFVAAIASIVVRFRRARGLEREQLKWFAFGAAGIPLVAVLAIAISALLPQAGAGFLENAWPLSVTGLPIAMGMAILRLRLYDIDVLINRTVVYGATTAAIAVAFFGAIVVAQSILRPFTGGSEIAVAISTLGSVGLVQPVRGRIQRAVDRRFYRSRYDAQQIVDTFAARLGDEVDLDDVRTQLLAAVQATVQPRGASLWLRGGR